MKGLRQKIVSLALAIGMFVTPLTTISALEKGPEIIVDSTDKTMKTEDSNTVQDEPSTSEVLTEEEGLKENSLEESMSPSKQTESFAPVENTTGNSSSVNTLEEVGEGFSFDETTGTLTITDSTGDYTSSTISQAPYYPYKNEVTKIVIDGNENTVIGSYAFYQFAQVTEIEIKTCGDIKDHAFNFCSKVQTLTIGRCGNIGDRAFGQCSVLKTVTIEQCGDFDVYVFQNADKLESVEIGNCGTFADNTVFGSSSSLKSFILTGTCGDIPDNMFSNRSSLTTLEINECGNIGNKAFSSCSGLESITIQECVNIGNGAFAKTGKNITIGTCGDISGNAFVDSANIFSGGPLESISIDSCGTIGGSAFTYLENLSTVYIGSCTSIGSQTFAYASGLKDVTIENCESIEDTAFMSSGAPIESLHLKNCTIAESAFYMVKIKQLILEDIPSLGNNAFQSSTIEELTLSGIEQLGEDVFAGCKELTKLTIEDLDTISDGTFEIYDETLGNNVTEIVLKDVNYIGDYAFNGFNNLKTVTIDGSCGYIGAHAFSGCDSLETINISNQTKLGYSDSFVKQEYVQNRVQNILAGQFDLIDTSVPIDTIKPEGWTSSKEGEKNASDTIGDTQITKEAKWNNEDATVADVLLKAYYSTNRQMDFVIVADCSNSMSGFGSNDAMNSNFYNMQSKMMDVADELLNSKDLDTRVAFSTFGDSESSKSTFFEKGESEQAKSYIWNDIVNYESNTNYSVGLQGALDLVQENKAAGRNTTVIFISDGQPFYPGEVPEEYYGQAQASAIRAEGVQIISVLQQVPADSLASSQANMEKIADKVFASTDLAGFSEAINDAIDYAYTSYTLTDVVDPGFVLDESSVICSKGTTYTIQTNEQGRQVITWTITGLPFQTLTLQYKLNLIPNADGTYPFGQFDTNEGYAVLHAGSEDVNQVETPVLPRGGISVTVHKKWANDDESIRPEAIEVNLLRNGEVFDTVTVAKEDNWSYTWNDLDFIDEWTVQEIAVEDYTGKTEDLSTDALHKVYQVTNTYKGVLLSDDKEESSDSNKDDSQGQKQDKDTETAYGTNIVLFGSLAAITLVALIGMVFYKKKIS